MALFTSILSLVPLISKILGLFIKTPEEKREAVLKKLIDLTQDLAVAVDDVKKTKGNTKSLEDLLNSK